ncbi:MAG: hypothetical protein QXQ14_02125 [Candidatus Aenigmatarchaeota archaeon]
MKLEKHLLLISLINFIFGFSLLIYLTYSSSPIKLSTKEISENYLNKRVEVCGKIERIEEKEKVNYVYFENSRNFLVVIFPDVYKLVKDKLEINKSICIIGTLTIYKNNFQIILNNPNKLILETRIQ